MGRDLNGLGEMSTKERDKMIRDMGKSYMYGWRKEEDGRVRWVVDEVPAGRKRSLSSGMSEEGLCKEPLLSFREA